MKKLTAEIARMDIRHLKSFQANPHVGLSMREEKYLQALEIALPVLEQQGGWISCSDRMPTDGKAVIVCSRQGAVQDMNYFWAYGKWWPVSEDDDSAPEGEFSHWQPLPAPPHNQPATPQIDNDGWMEWGGGKQPVNSNTRVDIKLRGGVVSNDYPAGGADWRHGTPPHATDIIAYRVIENDGSEG